MRTMRFIVLLVVASLPLVVVNCAGQTTCPQVEYGETLSRQSQQVGLQTALNLSDSTAGVSVTSGAGAFNFPARVEMIVYKSQAPFVTQQVATANQWVSPNAVVLKFSSATLADQQTIQIVMPLAGDISPTRTFVAAAISEQQVFPLPTVRVDPAAGQITASLSGDELRALAGLAGQCPLALTIFATSAQVSQEQYFAPQLVVYNPGPGTDANMFIPLGPTSTMQGKRIAFMVHGLSGAPSNFTVLAPWLLSNFTVTENGVSHPYYDEVWAFGYDSTAPLELVGTALAEMAGPYLRQARSVDLFGHSMGTLVSRYAMETSGLGNNRLSTPTVRNFVSLAGVHEGVPARALQSIVWALLPGLKPEKASTKDLLTDTVPTPGDWPNCGPNPFLAALNVGTGPDYASARYYTAGGTNCDLPIGKYNIGNVLTTIMKLENTHRQNDIRCDGLVAVYCSLSLDGVLAQKSSFYAANMNQGTAVRAAFNLNHVQIIGLDGFGTGGAALPPSDPHYADFQALLQQLQTWIDTWIAADGLPIMGR